MMTKYRTKEGFKIHPPIVVELYLDCELIDFKVMFFERFKKIAAFCYIINDWHYLLDEVSNHLFAEYPPVIHDRLSNFFIFLRNEIVEEYNPELEKLDTIIELLKGKR